jgi:hypothetical protein
VSIVGTDEIDLGKSGGKSGDRRDVPQFLKSLRTEVILNSRASAAALMGRPPILWFTSRLSLASQ